MKECTDILNYFLKKIRQFRLWLVVAEALIARTPGGYSIRMGGFLKKALRIKLARLRFKKGDNPNRSKGDGMCTHSKEHIKIPP